MRFSTLLTYSTVQSPSWEANWFAASQEITRILWNPKVHYRTHKRPPPVSILGQLDPVHTPHPTSWRSILILSSHLSLGLPSGFFTSGFPTKTQYTPLLSLIRATCPAYLLPLEVLHNVFEISQELSKHNFPCVTTYSYLRYVAVTLCNFFVKSACLRKWRIPMKNYDSKVVRNECSK